MGRKSSLSPPQWIEVGKRLLDGETPERIAADLTAKGTKVSPSTIRSHFERKGQSTKTVQQMAGEVFDAEQAVRAAEAGLRATHQALQKMEPAAQVATMTLVQRMRSMSESLAAAADTSAKTAMRLSALANEQAQKIDDADPLAEKSADAIKGAILLTRAANEAAEIPTKLLSAAGNRELITRANDEPLPEPGVEELTPQRLQEGVRRIAFTLHRAAHQTENT